MFNPTQEQINLNALVTKGDNICIQAGAGTGKSSSLRYFAQQNPEKNFLVLCLNRANAEECNNHPDKPKNIFYSTIHAITYREIVTKLLRQKLAPYLNYKDINIKKLEDKGFFDPRLEAKELKEQKFNTIKAIIEIVTLYCYSDNRNIAEFARNYYNLWFSKGYYTTNQDDIVINNILPLLSTEQIEELCEFTRNYWLYLIDEGSEASITHDVYLKLFYLRDYNIYSFWDKINKEEHNIDVLCLDEAQDSNKLTIAIFDNSSIPQKIIVGDGMQQLYAWRGAVNAMMQFPHFTQGQLTNSFRFNQNIADQANNVLNLAMADIRLTGKGTTNIVKSKAILCRTNAAVLKQLYNYAVAKHKIYTTIDTEDLFSKLYHLQAVHFNTIPKYPNKNLRHIMRKDALEEALYISAELKALVKLSIGIMEHAGSLSKGINTIKQALVKNASYANITVSTIHKAKGLEWDSVLIADSWLDMEKDLPLNVTTKFSSHKDNLCLLYVAITRAKVEVQIPWYFKQYLPGMWI